MFGFDEARHSHHQLYDGHPHKSHLNDELIAGGAAFEAMKMFENRQRREGKSVKHGFAKDMLAGIVGAEVGKLFDNRGLGDYDRGKAKHHAMKQAGYLYDQQYGQYDQYDPNQLEPHASMMY